MAEEHIIRFSNQGSFTGFVYACEEWGWTILDSWEIEGGFGAIKYITDQ